MTETPVRQTMTGLTFRMIWAWILILVLIIEWGAYFIQVMINLYDFSLRRFDPSMLYLLSLLFSPFITGIWMLIGARNPRRLARVAEWLIPVALGITVGVNFVFYFSFYQLGGSFVVPSPSEGMPWMNGMQGSLTPEVERWFLTANVVQYLILLPLLVIYVTYGNGAIHLSRESTIAFGLFASYMVFRGGSIGGTPFRVVLMGGSLFFLWILLPPPKTESDKIPSWFHLDQIPFCGTCAIMALTVYAIAAPAYTAQGLLFESWIWGFGIIGAAGVYWLNAHEKRPLSDAWALWIPIGQCGILILLILSQLISGLLPIRWVLLGLGVIGACTLIWVFPQILEVYQRRAQRIPPHHWPSFLRALGRFVMLLFSVIYVIFPYLAGASDPITDMGAIFLLVLPTTIMIGRVAFQLRYERKHKAQKEVHL